MARRERISCVETSALFTTISAEYGFNSEVVLSYFQDIDELQQIWTKTGEVWVYSQGEPHHYGWIKESHFKSDGSLVPLYIGLHHTRVLDDINEHDPLLVVSFEPRDNEEFPALVILTMIDHADMFGAKGAAKHNSQQMHLIHKKLDDLVQGIPPTR
ncbi:hypothetical protein [Erwinia sp. E_sp_B04_7]|uniref:hypothetical protein n=1 Tax=unclassified Erwinia TaxID=2622719 RepID=UPI0030D4DE36